MKIVNYKNSPVAKKFTKPQLAEISGWLRAKEFSYATIRRKIRGRWKMRVSEAWLSRQFSRLQGNKAVQRPVWVIRKTTSILRNGVVLAFSTKHEPLSGALPRRQHALQKLAEAMN